MAKLYFYYSAMNAGKSTTLLQSNYNYRERGMDTLMFIPNIDDRYGEGKITSRIGLQQEAISFDKTFNFFDYVKKNNHDHLKCILIDEAQFLTKEQVEQITEVCDKINIPVLAYGIRTDFRGEPFEGSLYLLAWAEELCEIKTICHCGRKAIMNPRVDEKGNVVWEGEKVMIGHNYVSTCRKHFKEGIVSSKRERHPVEES
ncbi:MAG: thymidine kinase [Gammaproteobacteria bacterium]